MSPARALSLAAAVVAVAVAGSGAAISGQDTRAARSAAPRGRATELYGGRLVVAGEVLVRFRTPAPAHTITALDLSEHETLGRGVRRLRARRAGVATLIEALAARSDVIYVEPNYLTEPVTTPDDPFFPLQTALFNRTMPGRDLHVTDAWTSTTGTRRGLVAIIDSGVDVTHPDLRDNIWTAPAAFSLTIGGATITCPAGTRGIDVITLACDPADDHGHGTVMAGVIGAMGNNGIGVAGVAWSVSVLPIKFIHAGGTGTYADAIRAIDVATQIDAIFGDSGAARIQVISASWRGTGASQALAEAVAHAEARDMLIVAAAGNDGADIDAAPVYPASLPAGNILTVGATAPDDSHASYSNYGPVSVDLAAPGLSYSTVRGGGYDVASGTSSATAAVSGVSALLLSRCALATADLKALLLASVDPVDGLYARVATGGRVNAARALDACRGANVPPEVTVTQPWVEQVFTTTDALTIAVETFDLEGPVRSVDFFAGGIWLGRDQTAPFRLEAGPWPAGRYSLTAVATDAHGAATTSSPVDVTVTPPGGTALSGVWRFDDIGPTGAAGYASGDSVITVAGAGADVWGTSDAFAFVHMPLAGDGEIVARVVSLEAVEAWSKAGVMLRESLAPDAAHAFMLVSGAGGEAFQRRDASGGATAHTAGPGGGAPGWVRLVRQGSTVTASSSPDGVYWTVVDSQAVSWGTTLYAGLAVTSHRAGVLGTAVFDRVAVRGLTASVLGGDTTLPAGWQGLDVGDTGLAGSASARDGLFNLTGAGADIWGTTDAFHFAYRPMTGDGEVVARVEALQGDDVWTKAGVMLRGALHPGAAHAFALVSRGKGTAFQRRVADGASSGHTAGPMTTAPAWVRLVRSGATVSAFTSTDGQSWSLIASDTFAFGETVYAGLALSSHDASAIATASFDSVVVAGASGKRPALPAGWAGGDVGAVGVPGTARADADTFTVTGAGADIWGTADAFQFVYTPLPADGIITARVLSLDPVASWTKAGVMLRQSLDAGSAHALMLVSAAKGTAFQRRSLADGASTHTAGPALTAPQWVRLVREGGWITALVSADGISWWVVGADTVDFSGPVYAGLAVSSHDADRAAAAVFTAVDVR